MKKYMILAAVAALTLASCAKIENNTPATRLNDEPAAIGFTNYAPKSLTKAGDTYVSGNALIAGKKFGVYSYATENGTAFATGSATDLGTQFMNGVEVTYDTDGDTDATKNTYSPLRYWPSGDTPDYLTFWAYYPVQSGNGISYTAPNGGNGVGSYAFTAAAAAASMVDFMVSDVVNDKIYGTPAQASSDTHVASNGVVPLRFHHMLTKVQFKFQTNLSDTELATTKVYLTDAKLIGIRKERTLNVTYASGTTTRTWANRTDAAKADTPANYEIYVTGTSGSVDVSSSNKIELTRTATTPADGEIFLMVPQTMVAKTGTNAQAIQISWDVETAGVTTSNTKTLYFYNDLVTSPTDDTAVSAINWVENNFITYTITVGPKPIRFTATVDSWAAEQDAYFNVN